MGTGKHWAAGVAAAACGTCVAVNASAAPIDTKAFTDFAHVWTFDGATPQENYDRYDSNTGAFDADGDGTNEWSATPVPASGVISITDASTTNNFWVSSAAATSQITTATGYTAEWRLRLTPNTTTGNDAGLLVETSLVGSTGAATGRRDNPDSSLLNIYFDLGATAGGVRASVPIADFFTVRIAATPSATEPGGLIYSLYVNDALVGDNLPAERTSIVARRFFIGDTGSGNRGLSEVDYVAFTPMPFAPVPVPEPTAACALAGVAGFALMRRRRSHSTK
jgi:hypothetical protein